MFTELHLKQFKSWRDTLPVALAPITVFFGANSSGKTSLLQSLLLQKQTTESPDRKRVLDLGSPGSLVDVGTYQDIVFNHERQADLYMSVSWRQSQPLQVLDPLERARKKSAIVMSSRDLRFEATLTVAKNNAIVSAMQYQVGGGTVGLRQAAKPHDYELTASAYKFVRTQGRPWPLPAPAKFYGFPDQVRLYYQNASFVSDLELSLEDAYSTIRYLGPMREDPRRQYIYSGGAPSDVGHRGELAVEALIAARQQDRRSSRGWQGKERHRKSRAIPLESLVAEWLKQLGLIDSFELEAIDDRQTLYRVYVRKTQQSARVLLTDVGFGVSQVLPVLVLLAYANEGDTVILEQPEIHLHPAVQSALADVIIEAALARRVQVIVESHSEHFLLRIQRRVAEHALDRGLVLDVDDVSLYFCEVRGEESRLVRLEMDLFGNILNWPADFFGDPIGDSVAVVEARARREAEFK